MDTLRRTRKKNDSVAEFQCLLPIPARSCISYTFILLSKMSVHPDSVGKIVEYQDRPLKITIEKPGDDNKFILSVVPTNTVHVYTVRWNKVTYCATAEQARKHILTALEIARISTYAPTHTIGIHVPFYPYLQVPATEIEKALEVFNAALENYF
jgi:hypothetical protein